MHLKKLILGIGVLGVFAVYSLGIRHQDPLIAKPSSLTGSQSPATASTAASGGTPPAASSPSTMYKDGTYTGSVADAYYGNVEVKATITNGKITDVSFLQYPKTHATSVMINQQAMPYLKQEAIKAQSANVQVISGATFTSQAFQQSLQAALSQA
ncbi:MAG TPA: FMN-binding protein [Candidatus Saccharimonadales bacterium]|nr:FMN-binding protein [Candidatus Saccharimonadales bacterium]